MTYYESYELLKKALRTPKSKSVDGHVAWEIVVLDQDGGGVCYLEIDDHCVKFEPYDYHDCDARLLGTREALVAVFSGKQSLSDAVYNGNLRVEGDEEKALLLQQLIRKPAGRKPKETTK